MKQAAFWARISKWDRWRAKKSPAFLSKAQRKEKQKQFITFSNDSERQKGGGGAPVYVLCAVDVDVDKTNSSLKAPLRVRNFSRVLAYFLYRNYVLLPCPHPVRKRVTPTPNIGFFFQRHKNLFGKTPFAFGRLEQQG